MSSFKDEMREIQEALDRDPNQPHLYHRLAELCQEMGRPDLAVHIVENSLERFGDPMLRLKHAECCVETGDFERAFRHFRITLKDFGADTTPEIQERLEAVERAALEPWVRGRVAAQRRRLQTGEVQALPEDLEARIEDLEARLPESPTMEQLRVLEAELRDMR